MRTSTISSAGETFVPVQSTNGSAGSKEELIKTAFADVMGRMSATVGQGSQYQNKYSGPDGDSLVEFGSTDRTYDRQSYRELDVRQSGRRQDVDRDELNGKVDDFAKDVKDVLKEKLDVSDDEIEKAMEQLGLSFADLLDPRQLAALAAELTGAQDMGALLCNSDFLDVMQAVGELGENLLKELGITAEELAGMLEAANQANLSGLEDGIGALDNVPQQKVSGTPDASQDTPEVVQTAVAEEPKELSSEEGMLRAAEEEGQTVSEKTVVDEKKDTSDSDEQNLHQQNAHTGNGENVAAHQTLAEAPLAQDAEQAGFSSQLDTSNIIRQIVEFARVTAGNTATTVEMQLNPEHLGKVFLELTSKNGMVSAHLTTQNEVAKEALESQMVELRQNLSQAGVKVEAVEVTVGSHEFERNLEQNAKQDEQQAEEREKAAKQTRRIHRNDLDELLGVMSEEESLVAQMMAEQGNSIDYTA